MLHGPAIFQRYSLLPPPTLDRPGAMQMLIGRRGSYTSVHYDWFGTDGYLQLVEGEKLWWLAPPESQAEFRALFSDNGNVNVTRLSKKATQQLVDMGAHAIVQRAGDMIFVPGGWVHCVKNLTDTVAFGGSYFRAWKLPYLIQYLIGTTKELTTSAAEQLFDWPAAFTSAINEPSAHGIDEQEAQALASLYNANKRRFHKLTSAEQITKTHDIGFVYAPPPPSKKRRKGTK